MITRYLEVSANPTIKIKVSILKRRDVKHVTVRRFGTDVFHISAPKLLSTVHVYDYIKSNLEGLLTLRICKDSKKNTRLEYLRTKREAMVLVEAIVKKYQSLYPFPPHTIKIKNTSSIWGSCSSSSSLSINYRIVKLPSHLQEYIVLHELCHLYEMNHSSKYWKLVEQLDPKYKIKHRELKKLHTL